MNQDEINRAANWIVTGKPYIEVFDFGSAPRRQWKEIRDMARELRFKGHSLDLWESSGWLNRRFIIRTGDPHVIAMCRRALS
jgi:hypothetical protein